MKILFVTNLCPHYRVKTFEALAHRESTRFIFTSQGGEKYWNAQMHGRQNGNFPHEYLSGFSIGSVRITLSLIARVWQSEADVIIKCITGRFALPVTYLLARLQRKPFVLWTGIWHHPTTLFHRLTFLFTRYIYTHADSIVVYGAHVRDYLIDVGVKPERIFIAWHAVDNSQYNHALSEEDRLALQQQLNITGRRTVLYVGRLEESKGLTDLVKAVAKLNDVRPIVVFVGEGELRQQLEVQSRSLGVEARFVGVVPTTNLYSYYGIADVFVLPSVTTVAGKEPWGLVINEAMNQGTPIVATNAVGAAMGGLIRNGETGLVVPERDPDKLAFALRRLLTDESLSKALRESGRREVAIWTNERMVDGFVSAAKYALESR